MLQRYGDDCVDLIDNDICDVFLPTIVAFRLGCVACTKSFGQQSGTR